MWNLAIQGTPRSGIGQIGVVLLNWNNAAETVECIGQLRRVSVAGHELRIVVVDNGSGDPSTVECLRQIADIHLIELPVNRGFAAGVNAGVRWLLQEHCSYILILNSDVILPPDFLEPMVSMLERDTGATIGIVSPKIRYAVPPERLWYAGGRFSFPRILGTMVGMGEEDHGQYDEVRPVDFVTGCCMLVRPNVFHEVGLFDEDFFFYHEDVDFCIRVRKAGYQVWIYPLSIIWHKVSSSTQTMPYHRVYLYTYGRWVFFLKHIRGFRWLPVMIWEFIRYLRVSGNAFLHHDLRSVQAYTHGVLSGLRWGACRWKRRESGNVEL